MKRLLKYQEQDYFNSEDYYLLYNDGLKRYNITQLEFFHGNWYSLLGLAYKMTSVPCINQKELIDMEVKYIGTPITGTLTPNVINDNFGVHWESGKNIKLYGLPYHWNEPKKLEI